MGISIQSFNPPPLFQTKTYTASITNSNSKNTFSVNVNSNQSIVLRNPSGDKFNITFRSKTYTSSNSLMQLIVSNSSGIVTLSTNIYDTTFGVFVGSAVSSLKGYFQAEIPPPYIGLKALRFQGYGVCTPSFTGTITLHDSGGNPLDSSNFRNRTHLSVVYSQDQLVPISTLGLSTFSLRTSIYSAFLFTGISIIPEYLI